MPNKQICPHCGRKFVNLSRHKCKVAPPLEETKTKTKKKRVKKSKSSAKKKSSPKSSKSEIAEKSKSSAKKKSSPKSEIAEKSKSRTKEISKKSFSSIDKEILSLIEAKKIVYQDEVIELAESKYDIDVKNVEKSLFRLSNRQKITIQSDLKGGIRKDRINFIEEYEIKDKSSMKKKGDVASWTVVEDCPCFLCPEVIKCNVGNNSYSVSVINREKQILTNPYYCSYIKRWIDCKVNSVEYKNPFKGGAYFGKKKKKKARAKPKN